MVTQTYKQDKNDLRNIRVIFENTQMMMCFLQHLIQVYFTDMC